jgi:hypothetical protein
MSSKRILGFSAGLITILLLTIIGWLIHTSQERTKAIELRHHVFCEQITPGVDRAEVREILSQYGYFRETEASFKGGFTVVGIIFNDPVIDRQFGGKSIVLRFENGKYINAYVPVPFSDANKPVCQ